MSPDILLQVKMEFLGAFFFRRKLKALKKLGYKFEFQESKINLTQNLFLIRSSDDSVVRHIQSLADGF